MEGLVESVPFINGGFSGECTIHQWRVLWGVNYSSMEGLVESVLFINGGFTGDCTIHQWRVSWNYIFSIYFASFFTVSKINNKAILILSSLTSLDYFDSSDFYFLILLNIIRINLPEIIRLKMLRKMTRIEIS